MSISVKYFVYLKNNLKKMELNNIIDTFLKPYNLNRDFVYLSKNASFKKITELLESDIKVICDITDRDGKINIQITGLENNFEKETCTLTLKNKSKVQLHDKFLYNIIYNIKRKEYSLQIQDEYYEKIESKND